MVQRNRKTIKDSKQVMIIKNGKILGVFIVPTGIGAEIGGHAGDANPAAKLIASCCDNLIVHPNVVNGSDINEMTDNMSYVEGSILDRFLEGKIQLQPVKSNRVLVVTNKPATYATINPVSAARATIGLDASVLELEEPLVMEAMFKNNCATGDVDGWEELVAQVESYDFDALAVHSPIDISRVDELSYFKNGYGVNPMGGVEAMCSRFIANALNKPVAHAPIDDSTMDDPEMYHAFEHIAEPRLAPEFISNYFLQCVLKGLWKAPRIGKGISVDDVDFMITPVNCVGRPHRACLKKGIPIIAVKENKTCMDDIMPSEFILVENYLEAAGLIQAMKTGISPESVRRPLRHTIVHKKTGGV